MRALGTLFKESQLLNLYSKSETRQIDLKAKKPFINWMKWPWKICEVYKTYSTLIFRSINKIWTQITLWVGISNNHFNKKSEVIATNPREKRSYWHESTIPSLSIVEERSRACTFNNRTVIFLLNLEETKIKQPKPRTRWPTSIRTETLDFSKLSQMNPPFIAVISAQMLSSWGGRKTYD